MEEGSINYVHVGYAICGRRSSQVIWYKCDDEQLEEAKQRFCDKNDEYIVDVTVVKLFIEAREVYSNV
jgi:hypothetical protein